MGSEGNAKEMRRKCGAKLKERRGKKSEARGKWQEVRR